MEDSHGDEGHDETPVRGVIEALKASHIKDTLQHFGDALKARRKGLDDLNVYPVPDGDTGTNMSLTVQSVVKELAGAASDDMHAISSAISKGAIMGARGNSGAILAQALRGMAESVKDKSDVKPADVAEALEKARSAAYESVLKPVEGTILTVLSAAAEAARHSADKKESLKDQMNTVRAASADALARTPDLLPVLKQAGVVDAGGSGFLLFIDALRYVATGEPIPGVTDALGLTDVDLTEAHSEISDLQYEVMFLMDADDAGIPAFRQEWDTVGDSIVVVGGDRLWNCHIHADDTEPTLEIARKYGTPRDIRITDLQDQATSHADHAESEPVETAVVAVVNGAGLSELFRSFGVTGLVSGGQSMNPSVQDLLNQVESVMSDNVLILPNNKNIIAAANAVHEHTSKSVTVIGTTSMVEGMAALVAYDPTRALDLNARAMQEGVDNVVTAEVTRAVRNSDSDVGAIKKGDWLGITVDGIAVVAPTMKEAVVRIVEMLAGEDVEILTIVEGEGAERDTTKELQAWITENRPNVEVEIHRGGQALYPYLFGLE